MVKSNKFVRLVVGILILSPILSSCGIPTTKSPTLIPKNEVPFHLLTPSQTTSVSTPAHSNTLVAIKIFFIGKNQHLVTVTRFVPPPAPLSVVLTALINGPSQAEATSGVSTAIPLSTRVISATLSNNVVTVNFNSAFGQISGPATIQAVSQVVSTVAIDLALNTGVIFEINSQPTDVPIANGSQVSGPVYFWQFLSPTSSPGTGSTSTTSTTSSTNTTSSTGTTSASPPSKSTTTASTPSNPTSTVLPNR